MLSDVLYPSPEMVLPKAWSYVRSNWGVLSLGLGQSCFEGAMYAFVFIWTPALQVGDVRCFEIKASERS
jgi:hypothetical protein